MPLEALRHDVTPVGLHYLLVHYDIPVVDAATWSLCVGDALELSLADLQALGSTTLAVTMECAGNGRARLEPRPVSQPWLLEAVGTGEWTGVPVRAVLEHAGLAGAGVEVLFTGLDRGVEGGEEQAYARSLTMDDALRDEVLLAWAVNGVALPPQHGFPLRLVVPGWYGMTSVKWLASVDVLDEPYDGYQQARAYRWRTSEDDPGTPVTRIEPRALMAPPGIPDFMTRRRFLDAGPVELVGRAWSGWGAIEGVDVSTDGGATWAPAALGEATGPHAWTPWTFTWRAAPGEHELLCRCRDASGRAQPDTAPWNVGGYANTEAQRVPVTVR
jgi:DMSO/TMAO reductase YedYZ molybdopterin-dependent catalytic subunit